jgi:hypothetical protein
MSIEFGLGVGPDLPNASVLFNDYDLRIEAPVPDVALIQIGVNFLDVLRFYISAMTASISEQ